jgi:5-methylcytosine-specific restriction endonuclease McrA
MGRQTWCSKECVEQYRIRAWPGYARCQIEKRDHGICSFCGLDTAALKVAFDRTIEAAREFVRIAEVAAERCGAFRQRVTYPRQQGPLTGEQQQALDRFDAAIKEQDLQHQAIKTRWQILTGIWPSGHLWEADHIVPVIEGGGECGLEGLRTLCRWCHIKETRLLAKRRARATQEVRQGMLPRRKIHALRAGTK